MEWPAVVTAVSTAVIAVVMLGVLVVILALVGHMKRVTKAAAKFVDTLERSAQPAIESVRSTIEQANRVVQSVGKEVEGFVDTSHDLRDRVHRAADAAEERLVDLEALLDVIQDELEETVLDVGAALRTTRRGSSILRSMKRAFLGRGRRR
jgi:uncharacterized protein YoxC